MPRSPHTSTPAGSIRRPCHELLYLSCSSCPDCSSSQAINTPEIIRSYVAVPLLHFGFLSPSWSDTRTGTCANFPSGGLPAFQGANMWGGCCKKKKTKRKRSCQEEMHDNPHTTNKSCDNLPTANHAISFTRRPVLFDPEIRQLSRSNNQTHRKQINDLRSNPIPSYKHQEEHGTPVARMSPVIPHSPFHTPRSTILRDSSICDIV